MDADSGARRPPPTVAADPAPRPPSRLARARHDARAILRIGAPLLVNNLSLAGMTFADTVMAGQLGANALGSVAVGFSYWQLFYMTGLGFLMSLSPLVAHAYGERREARVGEYVRQAVWVVLALSVLLFAGLACAQPALRAIGVSAVLLPDAVGYVLAIACGLPAMLGFLALRYTSEGIGHTRPIMYIAVVGLAANVLGNWIFMYGKLGMPALGAIGTGVSSAIVMWLMFFAMLAYVRRHRVYRALAIFTGFDRPDPKRLREIVALGLPICGSVLSEGGLFVAAGLIMGTLGATIVAAHQIALNYAAFMFMVPLALHSATTVHVGHAMGRGDAHGARFAGFVGIGICGALMLVSAIVIVFANEAIAGLYTDDAAVLRIASGLLLMAAIFQVSDGLQIGAAGALRGFKDARVPMWLNFVSYWIVGFPLAFYLGVVAGGGPVYVWVGLIAGLTACALALNVRYRVVSSAAVRRAAPAARAAAI